MRVIWAIEDAIIAVVNWLLALHFAVSRYVPRGAFIGSAFTGIPMGLALVPFNEHDWANLLGGTLALAVLGLIYFVGEGIVVVQGHFQGRYYRAPAAEQREQWAAGFIVTLLGTIAFLTYWLTPVIF